MRRDGEPMWELEAQHERPLLGGASEQRGSLGARRQRRRSRTPLDGVGGDDGVMMLLGSLRLRERHTERGDAQRDCDHADNEE